MATMRVTGSVRVISRSCISTTVTASSARAGRQPISSSAARSRETIFLDIVVSLLFFDQMNQREGRLQNKKRPSLRNTKEAHGIAAAQ